MTALTYLLSITPGFKGDVEQTLRILLRQPILFKSKPINNNRIIDYSKKTLYALQNRLSNSSNFESIKIDIKFLELEKLRRDREKALNLKKLVNPQKVNLSLIYKGKKYKATARLKGDLSEHWGNLKQWSLRIKLKGSRTIFSMNEFSISVFSERDFPYNYIISNTMREYNILVPRYKNINVFFNGENWGLMLVEEQFSESFYAVNKIKEAPIFKMTNENDFEIDAIWSLKINNTADITKWQGKLETEVYNENKILKTTNIPEKRTNESLVSIFKNLQEVVALNEKKYLLSLNKYINIESFAKVVAITSVFGDHHSFLPNNARYYLNPYNLKIEPIMTDSVHTGINENFLKQYGVLYKNLFHLKIFQNTYLETIKDIDKNFYKIENKVKEVCKNFGKNCQNLVELDVLRKNINILVDLDRDIFQKMHTQDSKLTKINKFDTKNIQNINKKKINLRAFDDGEIFIDNLTSEKLNIKSVLLKEEVICKDKCKKIVRKINQDIKPSSYEKVATHRIKITLDQNNYKFLEIKYVDENDQPYSLTERIEQSYLKKENFFKIKQAEINKNISIKNKDYIIKQGTHIIEKPIIIPPGYNLIINEGTTLKMSENAYIFVENGLVKFKGKIDSPINIGSLKNNSKWKGIYVNSNLIDDNSIINYVDISNISYFDNGKIQLTGGLNFINSNVEITNSKLENSFSEDGINIVNSYFNIKFSHFTNSSSDAIDIDFGIGEISNTSFYDIKGDAIDLSGSEVSLKNIVAENIYDKAISAGEETYLIIEDLEISSSGIGIASKDSSRVFGKNIKISKCKLYDLAVFQKKSYFSSAYLEINNLSSCNLPLIQEGSEVNIDGKKLIGDIFNAKELYNENLK